MTLGGGEGRLYIDGALADSAPISLSPTDILPASNFLGKSQYPDPLFDGLIDEFVVFNQALDAAEIAELHAATPRISLSSPRPPGGTG